MVDLLQAAHAHDPLEGDGGVRPADVPAHGRVDLGGDAARAAVLRAVALTPNAELNVRLIAAEKAHRIGALNDKEILRLYLSLSSHRKLSR